MIIEKGDDLDVMQSKSYESFARRPESGAKASALFGFRSQVRMTPVIVCRMAFQNIRQTALYFQAGDWHNAGFYSSKYAWKVDPSLKAAGANDFVGCQFLLPR